MKGMNDIICNLGIDCNVHRYFFGVGVRVRVRVGGVLLSKGSCFIIFGLVLNGILLALGCFFCVTSGALFTATH